MMKLTKIMICAIVLMIHTLVSLGQTLTVANVDTDPKTVAIGFVDMVSDNVESVVFGNPAVMSFSNFKAEVAGSYCYWQPDAFREHRSYLSGAYKINDRWAVAAGLANGIGCPYDMYGKGAEFIGTYTPLNFHFKVGASYKMFSYMSLGINVGFVDNIMTPQFANMAFLTDLFVMSSIANFKVAVGGRNIGVAWTSDGTTLGDLPFTASAGASYGMSFNEIHDIGVYVQYDFTRADAMSTSIGASYSYRDFLTLRAGGRIGIEKIQSLATLGCGLDLNSFEINVAYVLPIQDMVLSDTISVSVVYSIQ